MTVKQFNTAARDKLVGWGSGAQFNPYLNNRKNPHFPYRVGNVSFSSVSGNVDRQFGVSGSSIYVWNTTDRKVPIQITDSTGWASIAALGATSTNRTRLWAIDTSGFLWLLQYDPTTNTFITKTKITAGDAGTGGWVKLMSAGQAGSDWVIGLRGSQVWNWQSTGTPFRRFLDENYDDISIEKISTTTLEPTFLAIQTGVIYSFAPSISNTGGKLNIREPGDPTFYALAFYAKDPESGSNGALCDPGTSIILTGARLVTWGDNTYRQLGGTNTSTSPRVSVSTGVRSAAFYKDTSFHVKIDGSVHAVGRQIGLPNGKSTPDLSNLTSWTQVVAPTTVTTTFPNTPNSYHRGWLRGVDLNAPTYSGGYNVWYPEVDYYRHPGSSSVFPPDNNGITQSAANYFTAQKITAVTNTISWIALYNNYGITWGIDNTGKFKTWGDNRRGGLLTGTYIPKESPTDYNADTDWASIRFPFVLKTNGNLYYWNRVDASTGLAQITGTWRDASHHPAATAYSLGVKDDGTLWYDILQTPIQVGTDTNWDSVYANGPVPLALKTNGQLFYRSGTTFTQLLGTWSKIAALDSDREAGQYALGIRTDGTLWIWDNELAFTPVQVGSATDWVGCAVSRTSAVAWNQEGKIYILGNDGHTTYSTWTLIPDTPIPTFISGAGGGYYILWDNPQASFTVTVTNTLVEITNNSTNAGSYTVDWGDGFTNSFTNGQQGAPGVTPKLTHNYTVTSDSKITITLTAFAGVYGSSSATQQVTIYIAQNPQITVVNPDNTIPTATFLNSGANTLGSTSIFGSGNFWRWDFAGTTVDVEAGSGQPGDHGVNITHLFSFTGPEIAARVPVNRTVTLYAYNGNSGSPFASTPVTVSVMPVNPTFPNAEFTDPEDADIPDIFKAPGGIIWGKGTAL